MIEFDRLEKAIVLVEEYLGAGFYVGQEEIERWFTVSEIKLMMDDWVKKTCYILHQQGYTAEEYEFTQGMEEWRRSL